LQETIADLSKTRQQLQSDLRQAAQEKQTLAGSSVKEKERLQAEVLRLQTYSQQLEKELSAQRRPGSSSGSGS